MSSTNFLPLLETQPHRWGQPFDRAALTEWVASIGPWTGEDHDTHRGARKFVAARKAEAFR
jgi:hypothetical protein